VFHRIGHHHDHRDIARYIHHLEERTCHPHFQPGVSAGRGGRFPATKATDSLPARGSTTGAAARRGVCGNQAKSAYSFINFALRLQISAKLLTPSVALALGIVYQVHRVRRTADRPNEVHAP
jgi:hypothetical protein